jgi:hypothetical protein
MSKKSSDEADIEFSFAVEDGGWKPNLPSVPPPPTGQPQRKPKQKPKPFFKKIDTGPKVNYREPDSPLEELPQLEPSYIEPQPEPEVQELEPLQAASALAPVVEYE